MIINDNHKNDKKVIATEIKFNDRYADNKNLPDSEVIYIPSCLCKSGNDNSWYVRSFLESKYKVEVLSFRLN